MRLVKLYAGPVDGIPMALLPVGLLAFGEGEGVRVRFIEGEPLAEGWKSVVAYAQEAGVLGPDLVDKWAETLANGLTMDLDVLEDSVEDESHAFETAWAALWSEYVETQLDLAEIEDMVNQQEIHAMRQEDEEALAALAASLG